MGYIDKFYCAFSHSIFVEAIVFSDASYKTVTCLTPPYELNYNNTLTTPYTVYVGLVRDPKEVQERPFVHSFTYHGPMNLNSLSQCVSPSWNTQSSNHSFELVDLSLSWEGTESMHASSFKENYWCFLDLSNIINIRM